MQRHHRHARHTAEVLTDVTSAPYRAICTPIVCCSPCTVTRDQGGLEGIYTRLERTRAHRSESVETNAESGEYGTTATSFCRQRRNEQGITVTRARRQALT